MAIKVKDWKTLKGLTEVPTHIRMLALQTWMVVRYSEIMITSAYRAKKIHDKDSGIAATIPCRHRDFRSWIYEDPQKVVDDINKNWTYDPKRPEYMCAVLHDVGEGIHIHTQVHDNTLYVGGKTNGVSG